MRILESVDVSQNYMMMVLLGKMEGNQNTCLPHEFQGQLEKVSDSDTSCSARNDTLLDPEIDRLIGNHINSVII